MLLRLLRLATTAPRWARSAGLTVATIPSRTSQTRTPASLWESSRGLNCQGEATNSAVAAHLFLERSGEVWVFFASCTNEDVERDHRCVRVATGTRIGLANVGSSTQVADAGIQTRKFRSPRHRLVFVSGISQGCRLLRWSIASLSLRLRFRTGCASGCK